MVVSSKIQIKISPPPILPSIKESKSIFFVCWTEKGDIFPTGQIGSLSTIIFIIFRDFLMFCKIFLSPQVKRCAIITYKHGIYKLPNELPNNLTLRTLGSQETSEKCLKPTEWQPSAQSPSHDEVFANPRKKLVKNRN